VVNLDNTPPDVALTSPAQGSWHRGTVELEATSSDNQGVARVEFYQGETLLGTDSTAPYTLSWNTLATSTDDGAKTLEVKAFDLAGNVRTATEVGVTIDNTAPAAGVSTPAYGAHVRGVVPFTAIAHDNLGVERVEFYDGATLLGTVYTEPYSVSWDTALVPDGHHDLVAKVYDRAGNMRSSLEQPVAVDNSAPVTALGAPAQGALLRGVVPVSATASDAYGVERVEFYAGTTLLGTASTAPYSVSWNTAAGAQGSVTLTTRAYDTAGNVTTSAGRTVTVDNVAPTVAITSPANGTSFSFLTYSTTLQASASDNRGVTQVAFYDGATVIGTDTTAPYSVTWNLGGVPKGTHTLTAKAHDAAGNVTTSAPVSVKVN